MLNWLKKGRCGVWYLEDYWDEVLHFLSFMNYSLCHILREGNVPADFLAKMGAHGVSNGWNNVQNMPLQFRGWVRLEKSGLPYLRVD